MTDFQILPPLHDIAPKRDSFNDTGIRPNQEESWLNKIAFSLQDTTAFNLPTVHRSKQGKFLTFGSDNKYPDRLLEIYLNSALHGQIINKKVDYIMGNGVIDSNNVPEAKSFIKECNSRGQSLREIIEKCTTDHEIFGGFAFQVVYSQGSTKDRPEIAELYYLDIMKIRYDEDETHLKLARTWNSNVKAKPIFTDPYSPYGSNACTGTTIYYYSGTKTRDLYPIPSYIHAVTAAATDVEITTFYYAQVTNGMFPSTMISLFNGIPSEAEKDGIARNITQNFNGARNAGKTMTIFNDPQSTHAATIEPIEANNLDKRFLEMNKTIKDKIYTGHGISPIILGEATTGKLGQSSEINDARQAFQLDYVGPAQKRILDQFNRVLRVNWPSINIEFEQLPPLTASLTDEKSILPLMTVREARAALKKYGYIEKIELANPDVNLDDLIPLERLPGLRDKLRETGTISGEDPSDEKGAPVNSTDTEKTQA